MRTCRSVLASIDERCGEADAVCAKSSALSSSSMVVEFCKTNGRTFAQERLSPHLMNLLRIRILRPVCGHSQSDGAPCDKRFQGARMPCGRCPPIALINLASESMP